MRGKKHQCRIAKRLYQRWLLKHVKIVRHPVRYKTGFCKNCRQHLKVYQCKHGYQQHHT